MTSLVTFGSTDHPGSCSARVYRHTQVQQSCLPDSQSPADTAVGLFLHSFLGQDFAFSLLSCIMFLQLTLPVCLSERELCLQVCHSLKTAELLSTPSKVFKTKGQLCQQRLTQQHRTFCHPLISHLLLLPSGPIYFFLPSLQLYCSCIAINLSLISSTFSFCSAKQDT